MTGMPLSCCVSDTQPTSMTFWPLPLLHTNYWNCFYRACAPSNLADQSGRHPRQHFHSKARRTACKVSWRATHHDTPLAGLMLGGQWPDRHPDAMIQSSIASLACLLFCVVISAGRLSPPQNLTVEFLDFRGEVAWCPGPENPPSTVYTVELQPIGEEWSQTENCVDIESSKCTLIFNLTINDLMTSYYIRVKASWRGESSEWTSLDTVQPYGNTLLSAPTLNVSVQGRDIYVHVHMPQDVLSVLPKQIYNIQVSESNGGNHEEKNPGIIFSTGMGSESHSTKCKMAGESTLVCKSLNLGQLYCVRASAIHTQQQNKPHHWSEKCVDLPSNTSDMLKHIVMATILVLGVVIFLIFIIIHYYLKPRECDLHGPKSLSVVGRADRAVMAAPTEALTVSDVQLEAPLSPGTGVVLPGDRSSCDWGYECRGALSCPDQTSDVPSWPADERQLDEQLLLSPCPYSRGLDGDGEGSWILEGEACTAQPLLEELQKEGGWQLCQAPPCLDVPMSSLRLCLDSGGAGLDVGAELPGQSLRDSSGDLSSALENEVFPVDLSPPYLSGYEPRPDSISFSTHSPLSAFEQSVTYLKR